MMQSMFSEQFVPLLSCELQGSQCPVVDLFRVEGTRRLEVWSYSAALCQSNNAQSCGEV